jgi:long-chain acyl-CoA synthetase
MTINRNGAQMNIANGIREFAVATPGVVAVIDGDRTLTYAALNERATRIGNAFRAAGFEEGDRVGVLLGNRLEYFEVAAGLAKVGMPMVPINPRYTDAEVSYIMGHSGARALILDDALAPAAESVVSSGDLDVVLSMSGTTVGTDYEAALADAAPVDDRMEIDETDPFVIAYTAGTTGVAKGVEISHRSRCLTFYCTALEWGLGPSRSTIAVAPLYHGAGFAFGYAGVHTGSTVSVLRSFDPEQVLAMVESDRVNTMFLVPAHAVMIRSLGDKVIHRYDHSNLDTLYFNAAPLPQVLKLWVMDTFPSVGLHEVYGSTEGGVVTNLRPADQRRKERCVGPPWFMTEVRVVDDEGQPVAPGEPGELYSRSPFLMNGYYNNPEATEAATTEDGFLSAGDIAIVDDENYVYIVDRKKDMIISGGVNIYPREIEEVISAHPSVSEVAVIGRPSDKWGEQVTAFVVPASGATISEQELDSLCRETLAGFKAPREYLILDALPRNAAGKVLKRELRELE